MFDLQNTDLTKEDLKQMFYSMLLGRRLDERLWLLNRSGQLPFVISCQGQEATQIGMAFALKEGDISAPYYRDLAFITQLGITPLETMMSAFAKEGDTSSGGKQMPSHYSKKSLGIMTQGSCVATQILHAVGASLAFKMDSKEQVAIATLGEGSTNQGDFHEGLNFAGVHQLPFICVIENNDYAISVHSSLQYAAKKLSDRAIGYGITGVQVDGNNPIAVYEVVKAARERAIRGEGATLIEAMTTRLTPHSSDDDDQYRTEDERANNKEKDCLLLFKNFLMTKDILTEESIEEMETNIKSIIDDATNQAKAANYPEISECLTHVYGG